MNGHGQVAIEWMQRTDDERDDRDAQEIFRYMTDAEREEYEAWSDSLYPNENGSPNTNDTNDNTGE